MSGAPVVKSLTARFFIKSGETKMLLRLRSMVGVGNVVFPIPKVGMCSPLPTIMDVERFLEAGTKIRKAGSFKSSPGHLG